MTQINCQAGNSECSSDLFLFILNNCDLKINSFLEKVAMIKKYNKLVRDKIPEIIQKTGKKAVVNIADKQEYRKLLDAKLQEEVNEYQESKSLEELADICEVIHAIIEEKGIYWNELDKIRQCKYEDRGGFKNRVVLIEVGD